MASKGAAIKLYTNHGCPWAHRAHITLAELGIPFEEEIIDLSTPRTPEYLKVNPRGLVPSLSYNGEILTESAVVAQFLADTYPSHLLPASTDPSGALTRARIAFFVDAWFTKVNSFWFKALFAKTAEDANESAEELVKGIAKEIEPLLKDAGPFFGGSKKLTFAEASCNPQQVLFRKPMLTAFQVLTGPFVLRIKTYAKHGLLPSSVAKDLQEKTPNFHKWSEAVTASPSVTGIFNEAENVARTKDRLAKARA